MGSLQLKLINCKGLQAFNFFQKISVYALVSLDDSSNKKKQQQQQRTPKDTEGDKNPEWNHQLNFDLDSTSQDDYDDHLFLHFDLRSELALFGDKSIGQVRVLRKDLIINIANHGKREVDEESSSSSVSGIVRFVSYEVRSSDNKPNGVLSFSYKLVPLNQHNGGAGSSTADYGRIDGYPIVNHVNDDLLHQHQHQQPHHNNPDNYDQEDSSYFPPSSYIHSPNPLLLLQEGDQYLQFPSGLQSEEYSYYSGLATVAAPHDQIHYPSLETPHLGEDHSYHPRPDHPFHQFHYRPPPPPPPPPFPSPLPPPLHHHGVGQEVFYNPPSPWVHHHSYGMPSIYYTGDGMHRG